MFHNFNNLLKLEPWKTWLQICTQAKVLVPNRFECVVRGNTLYEGQDLIVTLSKPKTIDVPTTEHLMTAVLRTVAEALQMVPAHYGRYPMTRHSQVLGADGRVMYRYEWIRDCREGTYFLIPYPEQIKVLVRPVDGQTFSTDVLVCGRLDQFVGDPRTMKED